MELGIFLVVVCWTVAYYLMAVILYPPDITREESYGRVFERNRRWFMAMLCASTVLDVVLTGLRGDLLDPPEYLPFAGHLLLLGILGVIIASRCFQLFLAGYILVITLTWSMVVRRFLA